LLGTGHAPDLICGTYEDFADRYDNLSDNHLRTAVTIRITEKFPKESKEDTTRNKIKDTLLQIIKYSKTQVNLILLYIILYIIYTFCMCCVYYLLLKLIIAFWNYVTLKHKKIYEKVS
jgi:hypothetical protein